MQTHLNSKLTCFIVQKYDPVEHIFVLALQSRAVFNLPQDLGRVAASSLGDTFAVRHHMLSEPSGAISRELLPFCFSETAPVLTLSILSIYPPTALDVSALIKSATTKCSLPICGDMELPLLNFSLTSPMWPVGPLLIFHPHITLSPTSLPSFSAIECIFSFLFFPDISTYPMHLGSVLHNAVQSKFITKESKFKIDDQLATFKKVWNEMKLAPDKLTSALSNSRISTNIKISDSWASMENKLLYELLKPEPTLSLQNNDLEFTEARAAITAVSKLANDARSVQEFLTARSVDYCIEAHIVSTDLGMQGKVDLLGLLQCKDTGEIQKKDVIELKTTSTSGTKREIHFMQACTYFYATCIEQRPADHLQLGCDVIGIKQATSNRLFRLFGTKQFVTYTELTKRWPHNPLFYFLQLYAVFRTTYILLLELSMHVVTTANTEDCCIDVTRFIDILRSYEPKYLLERTDNAPFLEFLFRPGHLSSTTMTAIRNKLVQIITATHKHITGTLATPLAILTRLTTVAIGTLHYSFFHLKSGSVTTLGMYRLRFLIANHAQSSQQLDGAHCIASNIFARVLACVFSSSACSQIVLLESSFDLSSVSIPQAPGATELWAAYPLAPIGPVAGRSLSILMSNPIFQTLPREEVADKIDQKLLELEHSIQRCSLKTLEDAVKGPFYKESILLLVSKENSCNLPKDLLAIFARRGICTLLDTTWPVDFSDAELNDVLAKNVSPADLLSKVTAKCVAFSNSPTKMAAASPVDLLDFPILRQGYGTVYVFTDCPNSQSMDMLDCTAAHSDFYAVIAMLPEYRRVFFICS